MVPSSEKERKDRKKQNSSFPLASPLKYT